MENQSKNQIVKYADRRIVRILPPADPDVFIAAMYAMFIRTPARRNPEPDGFFTLGEIGQDREKDWERLTPYSLARPNV